MKVIIIGAGFTGTQLAKRLITDENDVVLIDKDEETVRHASNRLDCMVVHANGNSLDTLVDVGIAKADALVAVTESDELNMITCSLVQSLYPNVLKIARVRNEDYYPKVSSISKTQQNALYGIDFMVHPDFEAAEAIVNAVEHGAVTDVLEFENSPYEASMMDLNIDFYNKILTFLFAILAWCHTILFFKCQPLFLRNLPIKLKIDFLIKIPFGM